VAKYRVPVLILAGLPTPKRASWKAAHEFIHWLQDVPDQRGIVRGPRSTITNSAPPNVNRCSWSLQIATSDPKGPCA
jgi:acetolactate synthase-1/2/3 large subunit